MKHGPSTQCPHCQDRATARSSQQMSPMYREVVYTCRNSTCGHVFVCGIEPVRTLSLSSIPNPEINLALARSIRARDVAAQLSLSLES